MKNPTLIEKLGFKATDKVVIFHIDDIGFSHASNVASFECLDFGVASCGSVIAPAAWFLEAAKICRNNPKYDIGVHLTLTCEYELYKWRSLSSVNLNSGLLDAEKSLWRTMEKAVEKVTVEAAKAEMRAQIQYVLENGIDITHIDPHMGSVMHPKFIQSYLMLAHEFRIPAFLPRLRNKEYLKQFSKLEESGVPILDYMIIDTLVEKSDKIEYYCKRFAEIKPGLTHFLFHPAKMSSELQAIVPETAKARNQDYEAFTDPRIKECIKKYDLKIIGYKKLRDYLRNK